MIETGISLYIGSGIDKNTEIVKKAYEAHVTYAFTSLHIPEETVADYQKEVKLLLNLCKTYKINLFVDVGPRTLDKLGFKSFEELAKSSVTHIRIDYGFSYDEIIQLSKLFTIVFNASTLLESDIRELQARKADLSRFIACHNFYPKPLTALSLDKTKKINSRLKQMNIKTMAFVAGDKEFRGPLFLGLPTVEKHRNGDVLENLLELHFQGETDICLIGDVNIKDETWIQIKELQEGYVSITVQLEEKYGFVKDIIHHDRPDSSDYVIRSQESREYGSPGKTIVKEKTKERKIGSISISNKDYLRYSGELEVARINLPKEEKVNIIGQVNENEIKYLKYIINGMGIKFR
ncbi:MAG: MupG family TIM beta-alpha barrel fold protein [Erysipelotrichaceae bacterium]